ncbi:glycosyltransferase [Aureitalea sp. L0-47]|uniref:glycosyltransferase n=1 Tax=Aureitalea sp. L0-47 TaxID=2816962 RepID=UPI002237180F|nr:glycosyltransferase [Aureitalea sp. L0-47]MCW5518601.1 glycosyltransferase [Aureitalea sp. L0-47]
MRIGIVTSFPPSKVTLNEYAFHLVKHMRQHADVKEIILFTDVPEDEAKIHLKDNGCTVRVVQCWKFNSMRNILTIGKAIRSMRPDTVLYNLQFMKFGDRKIPAALGLFLPWLTKLSGIPTVVLIHNILEAVDLNSAGFSNNPVKTRILNAIGRALTKVVLKADKVAVTIKDYVTMLQSNYLVNNIELIPHGTFEIPGSPDFEMQDRPVKLMTFGKFGTYKKVETMIEAGIIARNQTGIPMEIVIAGTDNPNTPGYLDSVKEKYKDIPMLTFTGYVEEEDVPKIFDESTVVIFPYTSTTGSSGVLHQAGSYGKAVVMPDLGDLARLVEDEGYRGEFFEPDNPLSMANGIVNLVTDTSYRCEIARANFHAATAYPMSRIASMYMDTFTQIIVERGSSERMAA